LDLAAQGNATALLKVLFDPPASGLPAGDTVGRTVSRQQLAAAVSADRLCWTTRG